MKQIHYYGESVFLFIPVGKHFIRINHSRHDTEPLPKFKMDHIVKKNGNDIRDGNEKSVNS